MRIFKGYEDIVKNFWGLGEEVEGCYTIENGIKESRFWKSELVMVGEIPLEHPINDHLSFENECLTLLCSATVLELSGDGGFRAILILKEDISLFDKWDLEYI
jgi:hypothetical protein